jgi:hypothetical protein
MSRDYTMDDFHAEMRRRGVYEDTNPRRQRARTTTLATAQIAELVTVWKDALPEPDRHGALPKASRDHGNAVVKVVPCGVHPLHLVKVRASGARSGCPMCEMQIEDLCRSMTKAAR